jgi:hypothetical protein
MRSCRSWALSRIAKVRNEWKMNAKSKGLYSMLRDNKRDGEMVEDSGGCSAYVISHIAHNMFSKVRYKVITQPPSQRGCKRWPWYQDRSSISITSQDVLVYDCISSLVSCSQHATWLETTPCNTMS